MCRLSSTQPFYDCGPPPHTGARRNGVSSRQQTTSCASSWANLDGISIMFVLAVLHGLQ
jgi:hypothetical protein